MKLLYKRILVLVSDGVELAELQYLSDQLQEEGAVLVLTSPHEPHNVAGVGVHHAKEAIAIDVPAEAVQPSEFDGLYIPDGLLSTDLLLTEPVVRQLIREFHVMQRPIWVSGEAVRLLHAAGIVPPTLLVRDGGTLDTFAMQVEQMLLDRGEYCSYRVAHTIQAFR